MTREEAIRILASSCIPGSKQTEALETLIPELAESEDERIRKWLISYIGNCPNQNFEFYGSVGKDAVLAWLEKQKDLDKMIVVSPEVWDNAITDAYENGKRDSEKQKEQKPAESISQLTVQGKGVYKICPRCKERMVRDDSMVYTSMPPQYRYECPKCGESECDTVMYDNPEMEEQKPEWSEGEYGRLFDIEHYLDGTLLLSPDRRIACIDFLKYLRSQSHWKPSEEQMKALDKAIPVCMGVVGRDEIAPLESLYEQLKKL